MSATPESVGADLHALLDGRDWTRLRERLAQLPVQDVAAGMLGQAPERRMLLFRLLPRERSAEVFSYLNPEQQDALLTDLTADETRHILARLPPDDRTALLQELPAEVTRRLLKLLPPPALRQARGLLGYPPESVGRLMTPDYIAVQPDWTVARALKAIRAGAERGETANVIYVVDARGRLLDAIELRRFILAPPRARVQRLMTRQAVSLPAFEDREAAVRVIQHYDLHAVPVVDSDGALLGIVTVDDVMDVAQQEATEDFHKMGTVGAFKGSVREASPLTLYRKRVPWLVMLVFANLLTGVGIAYYEATIEAVITLVFFMPLIVASGGNAGAQAATLMVRAIATGQAHAHDWARLLAKELAVSLALGVTMGLVIWGIGAIRGGAGVGIAVALSMVCVVIVGSTIGMMLPFLLNRLKLDPAAASAPLITSIADIVGVLIYFSIATAILGLPAP
ncbi:MAG TPA: magnesium transporter [Acidiferrobacterales bacterium]